MAAKPFYVISIDREKCVDAADCRRCVDTCPGGVFTMYPVKGHSFTSAAPWQVNPTLGSLCTGCRACERDCPRGAVTVKD